MMVETSDADNGRAVAQPDSPGDHGLIRRADQVAVAVIIVTSSVVIALHTWWMGGFHGQLIEVDKAQTDPPVLLVDINSAPWPELTLLPGVSETLARRIVERREREGPFRGPKDLRTVRGVGPKLRERIEPFLVGWKSPQP